jgi:hypothetical protein
MQWTSPGTERTVIDQEQVRQRRSELRREFKALYRDVIRILFEEDPIGINFKSNTDEYEPEAGTILPRLRQCRSVDDVRSVVHEEFGVVKLELDGIGGKFCATATGVSLVEAGEARFVEDVPGET